MTAIGPFVCFGCENLTSVTIPNSVTSIGKQGFQYSNLTSLTIPNSLSRIEEGFCNGCLSLETLTLGDNLKHIGKWAFLHCESLKSVTIPYGVTFIGVAAFAGCTNLGSVKIPATVTLSRGARTSRRTVQGCKKVYLTNSVGLYIHCFMYVFYVYYFFVLQLRSHSSPVKILQYSESAGIPGGLHGSRQLICFIVTLSWQD